MLKMSRWHFGLALGITMGLALGPAMAEDSAEEAYRSVITHQLEAFSKDDGLSAYADAAPNVQAIFPSPDIFMNMVRGGYPQVYRNRGYDFLGTGTDANGRIYEKVGIAGTDGVNYTAYYFMERQPDGSWKISGCVILKEQDSV